MELDERKIIKRSLITQANTHYVLCEVLRLIYDEIYELSDKDKYQKITEYLVDAFIMSKKMSDRLHYYQKKYKDMTGKRGRDIPEYESRVKRRIYRKARPWREL